MHEDHARSGGIPLRTRHLRPVQACGDFDSVAGPERDQLRLEPLERPPLLSGRCRHLPGLGAGLSRHHVDFRRLVARRVDEPGGRVIRRDDREARPHQRGDPGSLSALNRHRVKMPLAGMALARRQIEPLPVAGEGDRRHLEPPGGELPGLRPGLGRIQRVQVHPAVALGDEPDAASVRQPSEALGAKGPSGVVQNPRVIVKLVQHPALPRVTVEGDDPAVLEIGGPN